MSSSSTIDWLIAIQLTLTKLILKSDVSFIEFLFNQGPCISDLRQLNFTLFDEESREFPSLVVLIVLGFLPELAELMVFQHGFDDFLAKL